MTTNSFPPESVPKAEITFELDRLAPMFWMSDQAKVVKAYSDASVDCISDPFAREITDLIIDALTEYRPYSVIRIGDGEANLLTYGESPETPHLDRYLSAASILNQADHFDIDIAWMLALREMMQQSIHAADIVGVLGPWRPSNNWVATLESVAEGARKDLRGVIGHWRGMNVMLRRANSGEFATHTVASAYLYFAVAANLLEICGKAEKLLCICNVPSVPDELRVHFPDKPIEMLPIGLTPASDNILQSSPEFLARVYDALPNDLHGYLVLVGAGVWAEIYCTWIKQRGGVAIDIGSGFDVMDGRMTRPVHKRIPAEYLKRLQTALS